MGTGTFFSKVASSPLFQKLDLPGSHKYQDSLENVIGPNQGAYTGVAPTLAAANGGYSAGGPGANVGGVNAPNVGQNAAGWGHPAVGGIFGTMDNIVGKGLSADPVTNGLITGGGQSAAAIGNAFNGGSPTNPYAAAARNATMTTGY